MTIDTGARSHQSHTCGTGTPLPPRHPRSRLPRPGKSFLGGSNAWKIFWVALALPLSVLAQEDAESLFQDGRTALQRYSRAPNDPADLKAAERAFAQARADDPQHPGACWFHVMTRFQLLTLDPELNDTLTQLGVETEGRNPMQWKARPVHPLPRNGLNLSALFDLLDRKAGAEIDYALKTLEEIPPAWGESFTFSSEDFEPLQKPVRWGLAEISMARFALHAARAALLAGRMYALDVPVAGWATSNPDHTLQMPAGVILKTLAENPALFTVRDAAPVAEARQHLDEAVKYFHLADQLVRKRDPTEPNTSSLTVSQMDQLRPYVMSLLGPSRVSLTREDSYLLNLRRLFEEPLPDRRLLPEFAADNAVKLGTFPDPTFGGVIPDMTATRLNDYLRWNRAASQTSNDLFAVAYAEGRFVAVGDRGAIVTSPDGLAWTVRPSGTEAALKGVAHGAGGWVAVGEGGTILTSPDGARWSAVAAGASDDLEAVVHGRPGWVAAGQTIVFSADGKNWGRVAAPVAGQLWCVGWVKEQFVAAGSKGLSTTSSDGRNWSKPVGGGGEAIVAVGVSGWEIRGATYEGNIVSSLDGLRWKPVASTTNFAVGLWGLLAREGEQVAVGNQGLIYLSPNGRDWFRQITRSYEAFRAATEGDGRYVVVGTQGRILHSYSSGDPRTSDRAVALFRGDTGDMLMQARQGSARVQARYEGKTGTGGQGGRGEGGLRPTTSDRSARSDTASTPPEGALQLLTPGPVQAGDRIRVKILAQVDPKKAWIAFYRDDQAKDRDYLTYTFFNNLRDATYDVDAPDEPGSYHFRLFKDDGYDCLGRSPAVQVR